MKSDKASIVEKIEEEKRRYVDRVDILNRVVNLDNLSDILIMLRNLNDSSVYHRLSVDFIKYYFKSSLTSISISTNLVSFTWDSLLNISIYFVDVQDGFDTNIKVSYYYDSNIDKLCDSVEALGERKKSFAEDYLNLIENQGSLSDKLALRFPEFSVRRRYFAYFTKGLWRDIRFNRGINYYREIVATEEKRIEETQAYLKNKQEKGLKNAKLFLTQYKQELENIFSVEQITYENIEKLIEKVNSGV